MAWRIEFEERAAKELKKLGSPAVERVLRFLRERLATTENPRALGKPLKGGELGELWRYRVGDYRLIAHINDVAVLVLVVRVGHRREVYRGRD